MAQTSSQGMAGMWTPEGSSQFVFHSLTNEGHKNIKSVFQFLETKSVERDCLSSCDYLDLFVENSLFTSATKESEPTLKMDAKKKIWLMTTLIYTCNLLKQSLLCAKEKRQRAPQVVQIKA